MADTDLEAVCERIAQRINEEFASFQDYDVRADAGSLGAIYVALRGARHDISAGEQLADGLAPLLQDELKDQPLDFAVSLGAGDEDLLLQIEVRSSGEQ